MKALIFAAGLGTRLRPLTDNRPKALVEVAGRPMLEHVIRHLISYGFTDIVVNIHHFGQQIVDFLRDNGNFGVNIQVSDERGELLDDGQLAVGALVEVAFGGDILESYPALFGGVERITVLPDEFDDRCALYLRVLGDLWGKDEGLNGDVKYISVDLAATSLTPAERSAVAWTFAQAHDAMPLELNYEQLCTEGYISGLTGENTFPQWEKGILFTITETDDPVVFSLPDSAEGGETPSMAQYNVKNTVSFDASKWRTALGAYGFSECVAAQDNSGVWGDYRINGPEWIS